MRRSDGTDMLTVKPRLSSKRHPAETRKAFRKGITDDVYGEIEHYAEVVIGPYMEEGTDSDADYWANLRGEGLWSRVRAHCKEDQFVGDLEDSQSIRIASPAMRKRVLDVMHVAVLEVAATHMADMAAEDIAKRLLGTDQGQQQGIAMVQASEQARGPMIRAHAATVASVVMDVAVEEGDSEDGEASEDSGRESDDDDDDKLESDDEDDENEGGDDDDDDSNDDDDDRAVDGPAPTTAQEQVGEADNYEEIHANAARLEVAEELAEIDDVVAPPRKRSRI